MKKQSKFILVLLILAITVSAFVACRKVEKDKLNVTFVSNEEQYATADNFEQIKQVFENQPVREGYVFKGWYLDKDVWQQEVASDNIENVIKQGDDVKVYAYWLEIVNRIVVSFRDYNGAILLEREYERNDDQLAKDISVLIPSKRPDDEKYTYAFKEWDCDTSDLTLGYYLATPVYDGDLRSFDLNYYVEGKLVYTDKVKYGEDADLSIVADPQKAPTEKYDYVFQGWEGNSAQITANTDLHAKFEERIKRFDVTFNYGNGKSLTKKVEYGASAQAPNDNEVAKPSTQQFDYIFIGWDNTFVNVTKNTTVNAKYVEEVRLYEVRFWIDDSCISTLRVPYGSKAQAPSQPIKVLDDGFTYEFLRWDVAYDKIVSNLDVHAEFNTVSHDYIVNYVDWDGTLLYSETVSSGKKSSYAGEVPTRKSNDKIEYTFQGWSDEAKLNKITRSMTVQAQYSEKVKTFDVEFRYGDGGIKVVNDVVYGTDLTESGLVPTDVEKQSTPQYEYEFIGWDGTYDNITANVVINAKYSQQIRSYEVKFIVDGDCIKSMNVLYGSSAKAPTQPVKAPVDGYTYEFKSWDKDFDNITSDVVVTALFEEIPHEYTVQFINWDGELLDTQKVSTGQRAVYGGELPTREPNDRYRYEFIGWTDEESLNKVTKDFAVYAEYDKIEQTYTVTFYYGHGLKKEVTGVPYGTDMAETGEVPQEVQKKSTAQFDFTFIDWDKYYGYVSRDMEINAIYKETLRKYLVKFVNNGTVVKTQEVEYDACPIAPTENIFRNDTEQWDYSLLGWAVTDNDTLDSDSDFDGVDPDSTLVKGEVTYTAVYLRKIQRYTVKFFNEEGASEVLLEIEVDYGTNVIEQNLAPQASKASSKKFHYIFDKWSKDLTFIKANVEVFADYKEELRSYKVTFMNGDAVYEEFSVKYGTASSTPEIDPTKQSDVQYDYVFIGWDGMFSFVEDDITVIANYRNDLRYYKVSFFNLATYEFMSTVEMGYGSPIVNTIKRDGYDFDSWYRDPNCDTVFNMEEDFVDGTMMLFGNTVMKGLLFNDNNEIVGYEGTQPNLIIPIAANGKKVTKIKKEAFKGNKVIGSVYIPKTIKKVENYAFSGLELSETGGIYIQSEKKITKPDGWDAEWNWNSAISSDISNKRPVTYGVDGIYTVGDFQYVLIADGNYAILDRFVSNNTAKAYIDEVLEHQKAFFTSEVETDEKTGIQRDVYRVDYETNTYNITRIAVSAFEGCSNVSSIFIPKTIEKVGNYAFSGVTANVFIQREQPEILGVKNELPSGWGINWNKNRDGQDKSARTLHWGVVDMDRVGAYSYIFMSDGTAIAAEYNGSTSATSVDVPSSVVFRDVTYTVTELGDELFGNMSLLNTVTLNEGLKKIGSKAFYMNAMLSKINLPSTLEYIGDYAFLGAFALKEIYIPASVKTIGMLVFIGIENLTIYCGVAKAPIYVPLPLSGYNPLWDVKLGLSDIGDLTNLKGIASTIVNPDRHTVHYNVAGLYTDTASSTGRQTNFKYILYNDGTAKIVSSSNTILNVLGYTIPESLTYNEKTYTVTAIGAGAFAGNTAIETLIIPATVTSIEANSFDGCSKLTIKTMHGSKPSGWDNNFKPDSVNIEYGYVAPVAETVE